MKSHFLNLIALIYFVLIYAPFWGQHNIIINITVLLTSFSNLYFIFRPFHISLFIFRFLIIASFLLIISVYGQIFDLVPAISFLSLLALFKLFELKNKRDYFIYILMVQLLFVGHLLSVDSLFYVLYILAVAILFFYLLLNIQRFDFSKKEVGITTFTKEDHLLRRKTLIHCVLLSIPLGVCLFFFFPRFMVGNFFFQKSQSESKSGFINELRPGEFAQIFQDKTPIFRARFTSTNKPLAKELYWRGAVLGKQDGFIWRKSSGKKKIDREFEEGKEEYNYVVDYAEADNNFLFTINNTAHVDLYNHAKLILETGNTYKAVSFQPQSLRYRGITKKIKEYLMTDQDRAHYLEIEDKGSDRLKAFANELKERNAKASDKELIRVLLDHYKNNNYIYTLNPGTYENIGGMEDFFFERRRGFCEHFSSTTAALARYLGIPSRVVVGFQGGLYNNIGDYYIIRGEDAHAWLEVWIENEGWVLVDPVSVILPSRIEFGAQSLTSSPGFDEGIDFFGYLRGSRTSALRSLIFTFDSLYYQINQFFLSYDREAQQIFFSKFGLQKLSRKQAYILGGMILLILGIAIQFYLGKGNKKRSRYSKVNKKITKFFLKRGIEIGPSDGYLSMIEKLKSLPDNKERSEMTFVLIELNKMVYSPNYSESISLKNLTRSIPR